MTLPLQQILDYRLDTVLFALLMAAAVVVSSARLRKQHGIFLPRRTWLMSLMLIGLAFTLAEIAGERERTRLRDMVAGIAPTYAREVELLGHSSLTLDTAVDDPTYERIIEAQKRWLSSNAAVADVYTFRLTADGKGVQFIVDSETDYDHNGKFEGERETRTAIGEEYPEAMASMFSALRGHASFEAIPETDRWGVWVSAFVPLYDSSGKVDAALGVDYDAREWHSALAWSRGAALGFCAIIGVIVLSSASIVAITRAELTKREQLQKEREQLQEQLLVASRQAGMAEVATGVLHNVGNVLNSVNVSARMIGDSLRDSRLPSLGKLSSLINQEKQRLGEFVTADPRGKCLPDFLAQLHNKLSDDQTLIQKELEQLLVGVEHIKEVVRMQQNTATVKAVVVPTDPIELMEDAIKMNLVSMERHKITLQRDYEPNLPKIMLDKHRTLQILINLISNAKKATCHPDVVDRKVSLRIARSADNSIVFEIKDNGVGIAPENRTKLFQHGFSAFQNGHGFGLHSGANAAAELGGSLEAYSDGLGKGAAFRLKLPIALPRTAEVRA